MADFSEINKRGGSNKAYSWRKFIKKNKKNSMLIRDFSLIEYFMPTCTILLGRAEAEGPSESNAVHKIVFLIGSLQLDSNEVLFHCLFSLKKRVCMKNYC